jgi:predicted transcriptional regulator
MQEVSMLPIDRTQVSLRVPNDTLAAFEKIALALDRDRTWVMLRALSAFLDSEGAAILDEAEGMAELDRGEGVELDTVLSEARSMLNAKRVEPARKLG